MKKDFIEKVAPFIGKGIFWFFLLITLFSTLKELTAQNNSNYSDTASFVGGILGIAIVIYVLYLFFKQIYLLVSRSEKYFSGESSKSTFRIQVILSLVTTLLLSCFIITIPFLIPQYIVLNRSRLLLLNKSIVRQGLSQPTVEETSSDGIQNKSKYKNNSTVFRLILTLIGLTLVVFIYEKMTKKEDIKEQSTVVETLPKKECDDSEFWSDIQVCLPNLQDMQNIRKDSTFSLIINEMITVQNETLAIYMDNQTISILNSGDAIKPRKTFQINAMKTFADKPVANQDLKYITDNQSSFFDQNWDELQKYIDVKNQNVNMDKPVLIEKYNLTDNSNQLVTLVKYGNSENIQVGILNNFIVDGRLLQGNFFIPYESHQSIIDAKSQNDYIMHKLLDANTN